MAMAMAFKCTSAYQSRNDLTTKGIKRDQNKRWNAKRGNRTNEGKGRDQRAKNAKRKNRAGEGKGRDQRDKNAKRKTNRAREGKSRDQRANNPRRKRRKGESNGRNRDQQEKNERRKRKITEAEGRDQQQKWARHAGKLREDWERICSHSIEVDRARSDSQRDLALEELAGHVLQLRGRRRGAEVRRRQRQCRAVIRASVSAAPLPLCAGEVF